MTLIRNRTANAASMQLPSFEAESNAPPIAVSDDSANPSYIEGLTLISAQGGIELVTTGPWANTGALINNSDLTLDMLGTFDFYPDNSGNASRLDFWSEKSTDGITITENQGSARRVEVSGTAESTNTKSSKVSVWAPGEMLRFAVYDSGGGSISLIQPTVLANGSVTVTGPIFFWALATVKAV